MRELYTEELAQIDGGTLAHDLGSAVGGFIAGAVDSVQAAYSFLQSGNTVYAGASV